MNTFRKYNPRLNIILQTAKHICVHYDGQVPWRHDESFTDIHIHNKLLFDYSKPDIIMP